MAMTSGLLQEPYPNELAHSETSALLVTGPKYLNWAKFMCECSAPTATKLVEATERWPRSQAKNETAYNIAFNTTLPFFDHLALSVERSEQFTEYMQSVTTSEGVNVKHLIAGFDWAALGNATVVDVSS